MSVLRNAVRLTAAVTTLTFVLASVPVHAQHIPLAEILPRLILSDITLESPPAPAGVPGVPEGFTHLAHFSPLEAGEVNNPVVSVVQGFNGQMATQFSTFPLGSSTGGLSYVFDSTVGTFRRGSISFGPMFSERAITIGRKKLNVGVNYQRTSYNTFEGQDLDDGAIKFYLRHQDCCSVTLTNTNSAGFILTNTPNGTRLNPPFEGDLIETALSLKATTNTTAIFADYGLMDHWDVGLAVPIERVSVDAVVRARVLRLVTASNPTVHAFDPNNPDAPRIVERSGVATGLGDIIIRNKYHFLRKENGGLAGLVDVHLPTGDEKELLGAGGAQAKFLLIASNERGRLGLHVNGGYTVAHGHVGGNFAGLASSPLPDEINYTGGVEFVANPRLTLISDFVGRTLRDAGRLDLVSKKFDYVDVNAPVPGPGCGGLPLTCTSISLKEFNPVAGNLTLLLGSAGAKYNPKGNLLLSGSLLFPLTQAGLRSRMTTVIGVEYAF